MERPTGLRHIRGDRYYDENANKAVTVENALALSNEAKIAQVNATVQPDIDALSSAIDSQVQTQQNGIRKALSAILGNNPIKKVVSAIQSGAFGSHETSYTSEEIVVKDEKSGRSGGKRNTEERNVEKKVKDRLHLQVSGGKMNATAPSVRATQVKAAGASFDQNGDVEVHMDDRGARVKVKGSGIAAATATSITKGESEIHIDMGDFKLDS